MSNPTVNTIISEWENEGQESHPNDPKLPLHPELFYRIKGGWDGWNEFLKTEENSPNFEINNNRDALENQAWAQYKKRLN